MWVSSLKQLALKILLNFLIKKIADEKKYKVLSMSTGSKCLSEKELSSNGDCFLSYFLIVSSKVEI
jgi:hypothetical protein